jgi:small subunit ribosomal protein S3|tara:strand:+ start:17360 stop:18013 length:654 start_codon:yes stop_codon:yes gene_type:complete
VGQKTHPTGFRLGINKEHRSKWFASYNQAYTAALKEDFLIRQFFEKEVVSTYTRAGISQIEIKRKINQLEIILHSARPKVIAVDRDEPNSLENLQKRLKRYLKATKPIRIKVFQIAKSEAESALVARSLADQLEKRVAFRKAIRQTTQMLQKSGIQGFKIQVSGRLNGAEIARAEWVRDGRVPLQTLRADISYASQKAFTIYGVLGIKVWIFNKEIL